MPTLQQAFELAVSHQQCGRFREAEALLRQILNQDPNHANALHALGTLAHHTGHSTTAADLMRRAIGADPNIPAFYVNLGLVLASLGDLEQAISCYRSALSRWPGFVEAYFSLGHALLQAGRLDEAIAACRRAIELRPNYPEAFNNLGTALLEMEHLEEAAIAFRKAIELRPTYAEALNNLGSIHIKQRRFDEAIVVIRRAIEHRPDMPEAFFNIGIAYLESEKLGDAAAAFERALALRPNYAKALGNLGMALQKQGKPREALEMFRRTLDLEPANTAAQNNLGNVLIELGERQQAVDVFRQLLARQPDVPETYSNLGNALLALSQGNADDRTDEAIATLKQAIAIRPNYAQAYLNLGNAYGRLRRLKASAEQFQKALALEPDFHEARWNLALLRLLEGNYEEGWTLYESRWNIKTRIFHRRFDGPLWEGSDLSGRRIILHAEQGFGDSIQFVRYAPLVAARGADVILYCPAELRRLLQSVRGVKQIFCREEPTPPYDVHCPLISLPLRFGTTIETIPADVPYLRADTAAIERWRQRLAAQPGRLKIGINWSGSPGNSTNRDRSTTLHALAPLAALPDVAFVSLQKGAAAAEAKNPPAGMRLLDWTHRLTDFAETAALMTALDLIISVETAVTHLAGALAKPTWALLSYAADWRYLVDRIDSPWYPTMKLFRQRVRGDWSGPLNEMAAELIKWGP